MAADGLVQRAAQLARAAGVDVGVVAVVVVAPTAAFGDVETNRRIRARMRAACVGVLRRVDRQHAVLAAVQGGIGGPGERRARGQMGQSTAASTLTGTRESARG